jgi:hypothetical protein
MAPVLLSDVSKMENGRKNTQSSLLKRQFELKTGILFIKEETMEEL